MTLGYASVIEYYSVNLDCGDFRSKSREIVQRSSSCCAIDKPATCPVQPVGLFGLWLSEVRVPCTDIHKWRSDLQNFMLSRRWFQTEIKPGSKNSNLKSNTSSKEILNSWKYEGTWTSEQFFGNFKKVLNSWKYECTKIPEQFFGNFLRLRDV
jgi:hypothetical protein